MMYLAIVMFAVIIILFIALIGVLIVNNELEKSNEEMFNANIELIKKNRNE